MPTPTPGLRQVGGGFGGRGWIWDYAEVPDDAEPGSLAAGLDFQALREALFACRLLDGSDEDRDAGLDERIAAVAEGRLEPGGLAGVAALAVEHMEPGPAQAGWLGVAAAAVERLDENELTGMAVAARQLASWAAASELAAVAQITSRAAAADAKIGVDASLRPARVCRDAVGQVEMALTLTHYGAEEWADLAVTLAWRLPATGQALAAGFIDAYRARLIADATSVLSEEDARAVEERVLHCAGRRTYADLRERLARAVIAADPEGAERRRQAAERQADVRLYTDDDQTATISASKLPQVQAAAGFARLDALARARKAAGLPGSLGFHRSQVLLGMMHDSVPYIPPADGAPPDQPPSDDDNPGTDPGSGPADDGGHGGVGPVSGDDPRATTPGPQAQTAPAGPAAMAAASNMTRPATGRGAACPPPGTRTHRPTTALTTWTMAPACAGTPTRRMTTRAGSDRLRRGPRWGCSRPGWAAAPAGPPTGGPCQGCWT